MDQQAFRQLLSTPAPGGSSASSSNAATGSSSGARQFGLARKREQPSSTLSSSIKASELAPRKVASAQAPKPKPVLPKGYVDRAEARRLGKDDANEYADVDKLREDFERRKEGLSEEDKRMLEEQMAFLGGDAKHSVLVKASGFKPIGSSKDKIEAPEYIWKDGKRMRKKRKKVEASEQELGHSDGMAHTNTKAESSTEAAPVKAKPLPSNNRPRVANNSAASSSHAGKTTASNHPANTPAVRERNDEATLLSAHASTSRTSAQASASTPATAPVVAPLAANLDDDDEDEDIFAGVGSWQGIPDSDSDVENPLSKGDKSKEAEASQSDLTKATLPRDSSIQRATMDWFRNDKAVDEGEAQGLRRWTSAKGEQEVEEDEATRLIRASERAVAAPARLGEAKVSVNAVDASPPPSSMRLQGFSDSVMSSEMSRAVLERERLAEAKREQRKKERMQGEGGGTEQKKRKKNKFGGANDDD
ncbi:RED PROTEIN (IK FACTOR) (CYTOKINE IK) [Ceraceosorus bombacis]|uniref:RED PROTEIN (IK FACTOR) (CYTOKINE IK) n=1 Tax=Ceraceosorus bombacis TaxID=401625 RepID=A0A0P1BC71_9BASI|nr:RED PROTEIN (IK FACTOR) (CYTOKINE IK) [Ceraceosorus bombacis]